MMLVDTCSTQQESVRVRHVHTCKEHSVVWLSGRASEAKDCSIMMMAVSALISKLHVSTATTEEWRVTYRRAARMQSTYTSSDTHRRKKAGALWICVQPQH